MAALRTIGSAQDKKEDVNQFCICAAVEITRAVMAKVGAKPESYDHDDAFVGGIFAAVAAGLLTQRVGGSFELVALAAVPLIIKIPLGAKATDAQIAKHGELMGEFAMQVLEAHNKSGRTCTRIGESLSDWIKDPTEAHLRALASLFLETRKRVGTAP